MPQRARLALALLCAALAPLPAFAQASPPATPAITRCDDDTGIPGDHITSDLTLAFAGRAGAFDRVTIRENGEVRETVTADASGNWIWRRENFGYPAARLRFTAQASNSAGASAQSAPYEILLCPPARVLNVTSTVKVGGAVRLALPIAEAQGQPEIHVTDMPPGLTFYPDQRIITGAVSSAGIFRINIHLNAQTAAHGTITLAVDDESNPAANPGVAASARGGNEVDLVWKENPPEATGCVVERSTDAANFLAIATLGVNARAFADTSVAPSTIYYYRIRATRGPELAWFTNIAQVATPTLTPTGGPTVAVPTGTVLAAGVKVAGLAREVGANIRHTNGNVYDQILLEGRTAAFTADPGQIARLSFLDLTGDIVQVEFSGAGTVTIELDSAGAAGPAENYNQPGIAYVRGHATIIVAGANETTNLSIFAVGRMTAVNQALFRAGVNYDGFADVACIAIRSANGKFGGLRAANAHCFGTRGAVGLVAPGVQFTGPCYLGNVSAHDSATAALQVGACDDFRVAGGDMAQPNARAVQVLGVTRLQFVAGTDAHGRLLPAVANQARYVDENGVDVTARIVAGP